MKVVQISASPFYGAGIAAHRLHKSLLNSGVCDSVFVCQNAGIYKNDADVIEVAPKTVTLLTRILRKLKFYSDPVTGFYKKQAHYKGDYEIVTWPETNYLVELEKAVLNADIIHLHWVSGFINYPTFFKKLKNKKIVWTLHDMNPFMGIFHYKGDQIRNPQLQKLDLKALEIKSTTLNNIDLQVIVLSNWMYTEAVENVVFKTFKYKNIPNGVDCKVFYPIERKLAREHINIAGDEFVILIVSEHIENYRKGIDILVQALTMLKNIKPIHIISVGKGNINISGKNINYTALGPIYNEQELAYVYSSSNLFIIPSREDNLPNVMLEAFACGIPVVGFPIGGVKQYVTPFKTGLLADDISAAALSNTIENFILNSDKFSQSSISEFAQKTFSNNLLASNHLDFYNSI